MRSGNARAMVATAALVLASAGGGCRPDFTPYNRLVGLRVLAIQSDPAAPFTGETATFTPLVFTPTAAPDPTLTYHWTWCPLVGVSTDGYRCPVDEQQIDAVLTSMGQPALPSFDLGAGPTAKFANEIPAAALQVVCAGMLPGAPVGAKIDCSLGFPIQITLTVANDTDTVTAVQNVKLRFSPETTANTNPIISGLSATLAGMSVAIPPPPTNPPAATDPPVATDQPPVTLPRDMETPVLVDMTETEAESYAGVDDNGAPAVLIERLFLTWFVESGDMRDQRTSFFSGSTDFAAMLKNRWTPSKLKDYPQDTARVYVVAHDNRGGVSWISGIVNLEPGP